MGFASYYLEEKTLFPQLIKEAPCENTGIIVIVPSFNEPGITDLLDSLASCTEPSCRVEVIIIVNAPESAGMESLQNNSQTMRNCEEWKKTNRNCFFRLYLVDVTPVKLDGWGVGMARKTGMDEALRRFDHIDNPEGIILNLDADCKVKQNYLNAIFNEFSGKKHRNACSIYFEHPVSGNEFPQSVYRSVIQYELHLRYYFQSLAFTGFPYVHHTVGSAIAVRALAYLKAGGMNRRKAGEDFYFVQKLVPAGGYFNLYSTTVYPSPRISLRVPFGTGPTISRLSENKESNYLSYNFQTFSELRSFFSNTGRLYLADHNSLIDFYRQLPDGLVSFIKEEEWLETIEEINRNTAGPTSFSKRFYSWFNMFRIVKYLNHVHSLKFEKKPVTVGAMELLKATGRNFRSENALELLEYFRSIELSG